MIPTTLPPAVLPRASSLTDAVLAPPDVQTAANDREALRKWLQVHLAAVGSVGGPPVKIDGYQLRAVARDEGELHVAEVFNWTSLTARRSIGLAAVQRCVDRSARTPAEAVAETVASMIAEASTGMVRRASPAAWLAELEDGARAAAEAEALTWATRFHLALEWHRLLRPPTLGIADRWWDCPGVRVGVRGRADARIATEGGGQTLFTMLPGTPGLTSRVELALAALVDIVGRPAASPPARVVGWWPDCGRALILSPSIELLEETAGAVVRAVSRRRHDDVRPVVEAA